MDDRPSAPRRVTLVANPKLAEAFSTMTEMAALLSGRGLSVVQGVLGDDLVRESIEHRQADVLIALGGDGTVLRAGNLCAPHAVPILGVNLGRIGFLTEIERGEWRPAIETLLAGDFWLEPHMMLNASLWRGEARLGEWDVLNECVIGRGGMVRLVRLTAEIDGRYATQFAADALIVATPTGSTAYALAAGGPILPPDLRNILVVPVAPHLSIDRAIVLHEGSWVRVTVYSDHGASISPDGQAPVEMLSGDRVDVRAGEHSVRFVRFQDPGYFYRNLTARLVQNSTPRVDE
jgi:NAD+ kinase